MRRFSLTATFNQMAGQVPPPLPAPPYPVPDLVPVKHTLKRHSIPNGAERVPVVVKQLTDGSDVQHGDRSSLTQTSDTTADLIVPSAPPTVAESVTHSEFESVYNANWQEEREYLQPRGEQLTSSQLNGIHHSQESLLAELTNGQPKEPDSHTVTCACETQKDPCRVGARSTSIGKDDKILGQIKKPVARKSAVIPPSAAIQTNNVRRISLPTPNGVTLESDSDESRRHKLSLCERSSLTRVAQVASAWEQYFNPCGRSKRALSTEPKCRVQVEQSNGQQPKSRGLQEITNQHLVSSTSLNNLKIIENVNDRRILSQQSLHTNANSSQLNADSINSELSISTKNSITDSPTKSSENNLVITSTLYCGNNDAQYQTSTIHPQTPSGPISSTFSSISSVDAFVLLPVKDLIDAYVRCNGPETVSLRQNGGSVSAASTFKQVHLLSDSLNSLGDSDAQLSQASSSTIAVSDSDTPTEDELGYHELKIGNPPTTPLPVSPIVLMTQSAINEIGTQSDMSQQQHPNGAVCRHRSVSTPNYPRRPLSVTLARHRIQAGRSSSKSSSAESREICEKMRTKPTTTTTRLEQEQQQKQMSVTCSTNQQQASINVCENPGHVRATRRPSTTGSDQSGLDNRVNMPTSSDTEKTNARINESALVKGSQLRRRTTVHNFDLRSCDKILDAQPLFSPSRHEDSGIAAIQCEPFIVGSTRNVIDQSQDLASSISPVYNSERRTRSSSASGVPGYQRYFLSNRTGSNDSGAINSPMDLTKTSAPLNGIQPFRGMRSRGIYKRNVGSRLDHEVHRGPGAHYQQRANIPSQVAEPATAKSSALSPAAQRYEEHVQALAAQRQASLESVSPWRSSAKFYGRNRVTADAVEEPIIPTARAPVVFPHTNPNDTEKQFENQGYPTRVHWNPTQEHLQTKQPIEPVHKPELNEETVDPEMWRDKLGLIARWQHEVNTAMQAGETDVDVLLLSPQLSPSVQQNCGWLNHCNDTATECDQTAQSPEPVKVFTYQPHDLMATNQISINQPIVTSRPAIAQTKGGLNQLDYDNSPFAISTNVQGHMEAVEPNSQPVVMSAYTFERTTPMHNNKTSPQLEAKNIFDQKYPISIRCALPKSILPQDSFGGSDNSGLRGLDNPGAQMMRREPNNTEEVINSPTTHARHSSSLKPITLDQVLGNTGSPNSIMPLPPLAQIRTANTAVVSNESGSSQIEPPIIPVKRTTQKLVASPCARVSFDCPQSERISRRPIVTRDYEALDVFSKGDWNNIDGERSKMRSVAKLSFSPSYNEAAGWISTRLSPQEQSGPDFSQNKYQLQGILKGCRGGSTSNLTTSPQHTETGLFRPKLNNRESYPIYEGLENLDLFLANRNEPHWTRVPALTKRNTAVVPAPVLPAQIFKPNLIKRVDDDEENDQVRHRSATRVQLFMAQPNSVATARNPVTSSSNSTTTTNVPVARAINQTGPTENGLDSNPASIRLRPNLRRAATISPVRKCQVQLEEPNDPTSATTTQQPAMSSGFVSTGSIAAVPDDAVDPITRSVPSTGAIGKPGEFHGLPPPIDVYAYPLVSDLQRGLDQFNKSTVIGLTEQPPVNRNGTKNSGQPEQLITYAATASQTPGSGKFLLGRVASNDDICIQTETPFAFTIAATDNEISITKVASVDDLKRSNGQSEPGKQLAQKSGQQRGRKGIPVNLRLIFGSESSLAGSGSGKPIKPVPPGTSYRVMYHVDVPHGSNAAQLRRDVLRRRRNSNPNSTFRYSLPCISYRADEPKPMALVP